MTVDTRRKTDLDPIRYEMFRHRLFNVLEEGRIAMQHVSGSTVVAEGGECMASFYDANGTVILTAAGLLLHCTGCEDAIKRIVQWFDQDPGIYDGDQFFVNDPYIAGTHVYDMIVVKPIFHQGRRIAWAGAMMHTSDTGGVLRGQATEIFHEGIRFQGVKIVEKGKFRPDIFRAITEQCRDPDYVGLDLKARIAANNVCAMALDDMIAKYGIGFVEQASQKIIDDSEAMARAKLRSLPDGTWRSRVYGFAYHRGQPRVIKAQCAMTKDGDQLHFDFSGTTDQNEGTYNCTLTCSWSGLFVALAAFLFWDVSWNGGMVAPVSMQIPEGSFLNCRYPAANGAGAACSTLVTAVAHDCIARMLYAGGRFEDVNALWRGAGYVERGRYGGHNQFDGVVQQQIYDQFASGLGATPFRDGVHTGAFIINPQSRISDAELIEMNYPFLYLGRNQLTDSGGFGRQTGGMGMDRVLMAYGTQDLTDMYGWSLGIPNGAGMFGGYPADATDNAIIRTQDLPDALAQGRYPSGSLEAVERWGRIEERSDFRRVPIREYDLLVDRCTAFGGSGFGDPLERPIQRVGLDVADCAVSVDTARLVYGVICDAAGSVDQAASEALRRQIRRERIGREPALPSPPGDAPILRIHESIDVVRQDGRAVHRCRRCSQLLGPANENYKSQTAHRRVDLGQYPLRSLIDDRPNAVRYDEYYCPSCAILFQVDAVNPELELDEPFWDIQVRV